jgi:hypothetical protein
MLRIISNSGELALNMCLTKIRLAFIFPPKLNIADSSCSYFQLISSCKQLDLHENSSNNIADLESRRKSRSPHILVRMVTKTCDEHHNAPQAYVRETKTAAFPHVLDPPKAIMCAFDLHAQRHVDLYARTYAASFYRAPARVLARALCARKDHARIARE